MLPTTITATDKKGTRDDSDAARWAAGGGGAGLGLPAVADAATRSPPLSAFAGYSSFVSFAIFLTLAFAGLVVFLAGLSALQHYLYNPPQADPFLPARVQRGAGLAELSGGNALRWDWWALFFGLTACTLAALALGSGAAVVRQARLVLVAWVSISTVFVIMSTNRLYDVMGVTSGKYKSAARAAYAGCVMYDIAALAAIYHLGLMPEAA
jgi:hypothetical protein